MPFEWLHLAACGAMLRPGGFDGEGSSLGGSVLPGTTPYLRGPQGAVKVQRRTACRIQLEKVGEA